MDDLSFYRWRADEEMKAARAATCKEARERHLELAAAYDLRVRLLADLIAANPEPSETEGNGGIEGIMQPDRPSIRAEA